MDWTLKENIGNHQQDYMALQSRRHTPVHAFAVYFSGIIFDSILSSHILKYLD